MNELRENTIAAIIQIMKEADDRKVRLIYAFAQGVTR